ncbi:hypothetical protein RADP37_05520 (plasmid) [Roseomonas mucosa]|uniref:Uncharacterized protein n=1 Tax=Roseomonas mucosa TaxID=207340 RepID=A0A4Y1MR80_9PROT|nr:hypothetical protein [Roseomonas mucosa]AWV20492.1 hypothetical protein RADP37_05520 [Roseomonas mucosa]
MTQNATREWGSLLPRQIAFQPVQVPSAGTAVLRLAVIFRMEVEGLPFELSGGDARGDPGPHATREIFGDAGRLPSQILMIVDFASV